MKLFWITVRFDVKRKKKNKKECFHSNFKFRNSNCLFLLCKSKYKPGMKGPGMGWNDSDKKKKLELLRTWNQFWQLKQETSLLIDTLSAQYALSIAFSLVYTESVKTDSKSSPSFGNAARIKIPKIIQLACLIWK